MSCEFGLSLPLMIAQHPTHIWLLLLTSSFLHLGPQPALLSDNKEPREHQHPRQLTLAYIVTCIFGNTFSVALRPFESIQTLDGSS